MDCGDLNGKEVPKGRRCMADFFCCTGETNNIVKHVYSNKNNLKKNLKKKKKRKKAIIAFYSWKYSGYIYIWLIL